MKLVLKDFLSEKFDAKSYYDNRKRVLAITVSYSDSDGIFIKKFEFPRTTSFDEAKKLIPIYLDTDLPQFKNKMVYSINKEHKK
jgi:hypothetical protein